MRTTGGGNGRPRRGKAVGTLALGFLIAHWIALAPYPFNLTGDVMSASAHHGGDTDTLVLVEGAQQGNHVVLEVAPRKLIAGSVAEFSLWTWRTSPGSPYTGRARLSMQVEGGPPNPEKEIPIPERGRGGVSVLYRGTHHFEQDGTYRLDLELADLPAQWTATLRVQPSPPWYSTILQSVGAVALAAGSLVLILVLLVAAGVRGPRRGPPWTGSRRS